ncbi:hypothetical protein N7603_00490 [Acholeplasma vituli]|uniref:Lipoprotein n=1 Tax=Paracholeplasma vituli TaxID=69473 RepID=A0ABT2PWV5_9MOLU|nr:hypothetical protein [Paracholeplasma vituli]MCU0104138.1 hypothetical protein [Paracholeplasma vituli]
MKKSLILFCMLGLFMTLTACNQKPPNPESKVIELIQDNHFRNGFVISPADNEPQPDNRYPLDYNLTYGTPTGQIAWLLGQAGNRFGLADDYALNGKKVAYVDGFYTIEDPSKKLIINPDTGEITFVLNTSKEYLRPRESKEAWPHLLIQQGLSQNVSVSDVESIVLSLSIQLNSLVNHMSNAEYNASLHTAQFLMYIVVRSNAAADAGEYMWFGIPFFDARYPLMQENGMIDAGTSGNTGKFIYQMPQIDFMPNGLQVGVHNDINIDLIPYFARALMLAKQQGALLNTEVEDLYLTNMNIGYEIPGTYDVSITLQNFSLKATKK